MFKRFFLFLCFSGIYLQADPFSALSLGPIYNRTYLHAEGLGNFNGNVWGAYTGYRFLKDNSWYINLDFEGTSGCLENASNYINLSDFALALKVGYVFTRNANVQTRVIPYLGSGYHLVEEKQHIVGFSPVTYSYFVPFIPLGIIGSISPMKDFSFGFHFEYQFNVETYLEINSLTGARWHLNRKPSWFLEFPIDWNFYKLFHVSFIPYYQLFQTGTSTAVTTSGLTLGIQEQRRISWGGKVVFSRHF